VHASLQSGAYRAPRATAASRSCPLLRGAGPRVSIPPPIPTVAPNRIPTVHSLPPSRVERFAGDSWEARLLREPRGAVFTLGSGCR